MNTITQLKQQPKSKAGLQRQRKEREKQAPPGNPEQEPQEEALYRLVQQDESLRSCHAAKLRSTPGYGHLTEGEAGEMVEQMLRLSCLVYEMLLEEGETPLNDQYSPVKTAASESNHAISN